MLLICLFFLILCSHRCFLYFIYIWKGYELSGEIALKNNHYYYYYYVTSHLQRIQNYAARVFLRLQMSSSITIHLKSLHWLPVKVRSTYKIACLCYHCHSSTAPSYVTDMLQKSHRTPTTLAPAHTPCLLSIDLHTERQHLVIARFLLSGTPLKMMSGVPHHCHHISLVWRHTCFVQFTKTELSLWSLYICAWFGLVIILLMAFFENALMCMRKVKLITLWLSAYFSALVYNACLLNAVYCFI